MADHQHHHGAHGTTGGEGNRRRLAVAFGITAVVFVAQAVGAVLTGSLALLVDTAHMLTDVAGLAIALFAARCGRRRRAARGGSCGRRSWPRWPRLPCCSPSASTPWSRE
jgi:cobalt-zinc-cadmium efflux system protein